MPCRVNRKRIWTHRLILEASCHGDNTFVTLTYSDENLPVEKGMATLKPKHLQDFLKRLRAEIAPIKIRFYAVGEYGDNTWRPHYHLALFGFPPCTIGRTRRAGTRSDWSKCCAQCRLVGSKWGLGDVDLGEINQESAGYLAGYVTKKMTAKDDPRLTGRHPEFSRQSNRGGIGKGAMYEVASTFLEFNLEDTQADVPSALRHGSRLLPLGRYLKKEFRKMVGRDEKTPQIILDETQKELQNLRQYAFDNSLSFSKVVAENGAQARLNLEAKAKLWKKKGSI